MHKIIKKLKYIFPVILSLTKVDTINAQFPGEEYVVEINNTNGAWKKTGPAIAGITYVYIDERAYDENTGTFFFESSETSRRLYSVNVATGSIINSPLIDDILEFQFDTKSAMLYGLNLGNGLSFISLNQVTGAYTTIGNSLPVNSCVQGLSAYDSSNHTYMFVSSNSLFSLNATNGNIISSPSLAVVAGQSISNFSFNNLSGTLYGLLQDNNRYYLIAINSTTGTISRIGPGTNFGAGTLESSSAINEVNQQYIYLYSDPNGNYFVTTMDIATGNVISNAQLKPTPSTNYDNFFNLKYDNVQGKLFATHWETPTTTVAPPPLMATTPILTNVTVDVTDSQVGQVTVKWRSPFQANPLLFPPPYSYIVLRSKNSAATSNMKIANPGQLTDSTFIDTNLNTVYPNNYYYRVLAYSSNGQFVDSSAMASSVQLALIPVNNGIQLNWNATVPWSNKSSQFPKHWIYRGSNTGATKIGDLTLIDSVEVAQLAQFTYVDLGQYNNSPLSDIQNYCYAVMTKGSYDDPLIQAPLRNFSEVTCSVPENNAPPCAPTLAVTGIDCSTYTACPLIGGGTVQENYSNILKWTKPASNSNCNPAIAGYNVYASRSGTQPYTLIAQAITDTFFVQSNLPSFAMCYKVSTVGKGGIESILSDQFCFDNCPNYVLPNVFTPNGDNCNDVFSAFSLRNVTENGTTPCGQLDNTQLGVWRANCARFVTGVAFTVYNRWGKEVYSYGSDSDNSVYIDWNGKDNAGMDLDAGTYYYVVHLVFDVIDPRKQYKTINGWVVLLR